MENVILNEELATPIGAERKHVILLGHHIGTGNRLVYVLEGDIETDAIVTVDDPELQLYVPKDYIETGNSLAWFTEEDILHPNIVVTLHEADPVYQDSI